MPSYKVIYFDSRGRGELPRLLFHAAGVPFEDVRLTKEEFQAMKPTLPFEQLPVLEVDGKIYAQTLGIATYLAREFGFYGKTNLESLKISETLFHLVDVFAIVIKVFYESDEARKEQYKKEAVEEKLPKAIEYLAKLLQKSGTGYFVGSEMTLADISVFDMCTLLEGFKVLEIAKCPVEIQQLVEKVSTHPKLAKYISERK